jgi:uncharacterized protein YdeI (YjbR/CyaY-like superfamily)
VPASPKNPKVTKALGEKTTWKAEYKALRDIALASGLTEELKWGWPCYSVESGGNVVLIHGFKDYCALLFMKGALMKDPKGVLIQQTKNVQSSRQIRFTGVKEIEKLATALKGYIKNAIEVENSGQKVQKKSTEDFEVASEFVDAMDNDPELKEAFDDLTPGRQRSWLLHFSGAKQSKTRIDRIAKARKKIFAGKGMLE